MCGLGALSQHPQECWTIAVVAAQRQGSFLPLSSEQARSLALCHVAPPAPAGQELQPSLTVCVKLSQVAKSDDVLRTVCAPAAEPNLLPVCDTLQFGAVCMPLVLHANCPTLVLPLAGRLDGAAYKAATSGVGSSYFCSACWSGGTLACIQELEVVCRQA